MPRLNSAGTGASLRGNGSTRGYSVMLRGSVNSSIRNWSINLGGVVLSITCETSTRRSPRRPSSRGKIVVVRSRSFSTSAARSSIASARNFSKSSMSSSSAAIGALLGMSGGCDRSAPSEPTPCHHAPMSTGSHQARGYSKACWRCQRWGDFAHGGATHSLCTQPRSRSSGKAWCLRARSGAARAGGRRHRPTANQSDRSAEDLRPTPTSRKPRAAGSARGTVCRPLSAVELNSVGLHSRSRSILRKLAGGGRSGRLATHDPSRVFLDLPSIALTVLAVLLWRPQTRLPQAEDLKWTAIAFNR
jgi:hypothetical protein